MARRTSAGPDRVTVPSSSACDQRTSPRQMRVSVRRLVSMVAATSWPGSKSHTSASPLATTSHQRDALGATPSRRNANVVRDLGHVSIGIVRRMSHISRCGSRSSSPSSPIHRTPQAPRASTTSASSLPHSVSEYVVRPSISLRSTTPARVSDFNRFDSSAGDIFGTPRRRSLKCLLPSNSSRTTSIVQRSSSNSIALATGQNWPYPDIALPPRFAISQYRYRTRRGTYLLLVWRRSGDDDVCTDEGGHRP